MTDNNDLPLRRLQFHADVTDKELTPLEKIILYVAEGAMDGDKCIDFFAVSLAERAAEQLEDLKGQTK